MKEFLKDIFTYHHHFNQKLTDLFIDNKDALSERTIPLFSHNINAHQIWNSRILGKNPLGVHQVHSLETCRNLDYSNYEDTLLIISEFDFAERIKYKNSSGGEFENSVQEILFHISNHSTHHKGQLISDLRQNGIAPMITDYIYYKI